MQFILYILYLPKGTVVCQKNKITNGSMHQATAIYTESVEMYWYLQDATDLIGDF